MDKFKPKIALEGSGYSDPRDGSTNTTSRSTGGQETQASAPDIPEDPDTYKKKEKKYMTIDPPKKEVVEVKDKEMSNKELRSILKNSRKEEKKVQTCIDLVEGKVHNVKTARLWKELTENLKKVISLKKTAQTEEWEDPDDAVLQQISNESLETTYNNYVAQGEMPDDIYWKLQQSLIQSNWTKEQAKEKVDNLWNIMGISHGDESSPTQESYGDTEDIYEQYEQPQERGEKASDYVKERPEEVVEPKQFSDRQHMKSMMDRNQLEPGATYESKPQIKIREMAAYSQSPKLRQKIQKQNPELAQRMENYMSRKVGGLGEVGRQMFAKDPANFWKLVHKKPEDFETAAQQFASTGEMPLQSLNPGQAKGMPQFKDVKTAPAPGTAGSYEMSTQDEQLATNREKFQQPTQELPYQSDQPTMEAIPAGYNPAGQDPQRDRAREQADIGNIERLKNPERTLPTEEIKKREEETEQLSEQIGTPYKEQIPGADKPEVIEEVPAQPATEQLAESSEQKVIEGPDITQEKLDVNDTSETSGLDLVTETAPEAKAEEVVPEAAVPGQPSSSAISKLSNAMEDPETGRTSPEFLPTGGWNQEKAKEIFTPEAFKEAFSDSFVVPAESADVYGKYMNYGKQMNEWKNPLSKGLWEGFMETFGHGPKVKDEESPEVKTRSQRALEFAKTIKDNAPLFNAFKTFVKPYLQRKEVLEEDKVEFKTKEEVEEFEKENKPGLGSSARLRTVTSNKLVRGELINGPEWLHRVASDNKFLPVGNYACILLTNKLVAVRLPDSYKAEKRMEPEEVKELYKAGAPTWAIPR